MEFNDKRNVTLSFQEKNERKQEGIVKEKEEEREEENKS